MPRMAVLIGLTGALSLCSVSLCGCLSNGSFNSAGMAHVVPADPLFLTRPSPYDPAPMTGTSPAGSISPVLYSTPADDPFGPTFVSSPAVAEPIAPSREVRTSATTPDLGRIYGRTAQSDDRDRNPIIVIPGVLGSRLVDEQSHRVVWGEFGGSGINPSSADGARLIALPMAQGKSINSLTDDVAAVGTLDALDVRLFGIPFQINAYRDLLTALGVGGYRDTDTKLADISYGDQSYSSFQFAYDWRRDNIENAQRLHQFILEKKAYVEGERRKRYGNDIAPVRFDIVAHSMGGLVARYYLEYGNADLPTDGSMPQATWAGAEHVARLVMIATPNAGSLDSIANLVQGETLSRFLPRYEAAILGTMPSLYQLLPRARQRPIVVETDRQSLDVMNPRVWQYYRWGLLDPRQQSMLKELLPEVSDPNVRQQIAYDHLAKCLNRAKSFQAALDTPAKPPVGTTIHLIAGDAHPTISQYRIDGRGALTVSASQPGDGRVSRASALMDERYSTGAKWTPRLNTPIAWSSVNFLFADHLGLTSDPGFTDNILFLLLESPR
jgi:pimeloyl-ACP methyl ester carboxylesterase